MNPLTNVRNIQNLNKRELDLGVPFAQSWHQQYRESAWIFIGGLDYDLTEGDIICLFSQYGEVVNINLIRDQKTGKSKGFAFLCYENQRSTVLSVDNLNSIKLCGRTIRVDHVEEYKVPKMKEDMAPEKIKLALEGCAPQLQPPPPPPGRRGDGGDRRDTGRSSQSSGPASAVKAEPQQLDDIALPPRLFDVGVKTENGASFKKKSKDKKSKKSKKSKKKKSKSKKSKKSKASDSSSSGSDSEDCSESDSERDRSCQQRLGGGRSRAGEGSGASFSHGRRPDQSSADGRDSVRVKEEPRDRGYSSRRETAGGGFSDRGSSARDLKGRVKEEPLSDDSEGYEGRGRSRGHGRGDQGRHGGSKNRREEGCGDVNGGGKRKCEEDESEGGRKYDERDKYSDNYRHKSTTDKGYTNSSRDHSSNRELNNYRRDASSDRGYGRDYDRARR